MKTIQISDRENIQMYKDGYDPYAWIKGIAQNAKKGAICSK